MRNIKRNPVLMYSTVEFQAQGADKGQFPSGQLYTENKQPSVITTATYCICP